MTTPRVLSNGEDGTLLQTPVTLTHTGPAQALPDGASIATDACFDLTAAPAGDFTLTIAQGVELVYTEQDSTCVLRFADTVRGTDFSGGRTERRVQLARPCRSLRVLGDRSSLEVFLNEGAAVFSTRYYPAPGDVALQITGADAAVYILQ